MFLKYAEDKKAVACNTSGVKDNYKAGHSLSAGYKYFITYMILHIKFGLNNKSSTNKSKSS